jgi:hypothetical protein
MPESVRGVIDKVGAGISLTADELGALKQLGEGLTGLAKHHVDEYLQAVGEAKEDFDLQRGMGVDLLQGYLLCRPQEQPPPPVSG